MKVNRGLAEMLKGGVIMDVVNPEQAKIAEDAGATAVMALERVPADIRRDGGVARMSDPEMIEGIKAVVTIPVMAKARIGHFVEAQILEALGVDFIDESEVLTPADETHHIDKFAFTSPFVCGATNLGEALRRISEGAALIRSKGEAGTGNVVEAVRHLRSIFGDIRRITQADSAELFDWAKKLGAPLPLVQEIAETGKLQVPIFCAGGIATPADAALAMQLGAEAVFVGSGIFKSDDPRVVGVLALQGAFEAHQHVLRDLGVESVQVRTPADLEMVDALVMPGGESTTMSHLLQTSGLFDVIDARLKQGMPVFGTCAGMILLAKGVLDGRSDQKSFGAIDIDVKRNAYGRQIDSFETDISLVGLVEDFHAVFIRAPQIARIGDDVTVLARHNENVVLARQGSVMVASFHPELTNDARIHSMFIGLLQEV
jgi:pyridoxal 5'-phosphate synthase pdxS subunit